MENKIKDRLLSRLKDRLNEELDDYREIKIELADILEWKKVRESNINELQEEIREIENNL